MFGLFDSESLWLDITNVLIGLMTIIILYVVGRVTYKEIRIRAANRVRVPWEKDSHAFRISDLGITMADGGERIDEKKKNILPHFQDGDDPPNIESANN
jgi:hypothetical protein